MICSMTAEAVIPVGRSASASAAVHRRPRAAHSWLSGRNAVTASRAGSHAGSSAPVQENASRPASAQQAPPGCQCLAWLVEPGQDHGGDHRVEQVRRVRQPGDVLAVEPDAGGPAFCCFVPDAGGHRRSPVDAQYPSAGLDSAGRGERGCPGAAADVEDVHAGLQARDLGQPGSDGPVPFGSAGWPGHPMPRARAGSARSRGHPGNSARDWRGLRRSWWGWRSPVWRARPAGAGVTGRTCPACGEQHLIWQLQAGMRAARQCRRPGRVSRHHA